MRYRFKCFLLQLTILGIAYGKIDTYIGGEAAARWRWDSREIYPNNRFELAKIRPRIDVDFDSLFSVRISFELSNIVAALRDAYVKWNHSRSFGFAMGRKRKPFGFEDILGTWNAPAVELTEVTNLFDDAGYLERDIGIWASGVMFKEPYKIRYDFGMYNGHCGTAKTSEKQFIGLLVYSPLKELDLVGSFGAGMDTLGLDWRTAWDIAAYCKWEKFEFAGEYASGNDIITDDNIEGYHLWTRYEIGKFSPYVQFERTSSQPKDSDIEDITQRTHIGLMFAPTKGIRLRGQGTYVNDSDNQPHYELTIQVHARF